MNFYKITNKSEKHHRMQYKTGLNVDIRPFNPKGNCKRGGINFSREDILVFLNFGPWIRKVTLPEDAKVYENPIILKVYENPGIIKKWKADKVILGRRSKITPKKIKQLIEEGANPKIGDSYPLRWAAKNGNLEIVKLLLPVSDPKSYGSEALRWASINGHLKMVKLLIPVSEPKDNDSAALKWAARRKHSRIVKLLIPVSDPKIVKELKLD